MKKLLLVALILLNLAIFTALSQGDSSGQAIAQYGGGGGNFVAITAKIGSDEDAQFIINPQTKMLFGVRTDTSHKKAEMQIFAYRNLNRDFPLVDEPSEDSTSEESPDSTDNDNDRNSRNRRSRR